VLAMSIVKVRYRKRLRFFYVSLIVFSILFIMTLVFSLTIGSANIGVDGVFEWILYKIGIHALQPVNEGVLKIIELRFVRTLTAFIVGVMLGVSGVILQACSRNPLADPFILGLSSGALSFLALAMLISPALIYLRPIAIAIAFIGALIGFTITLALFEATGGTSTSLVLSGIAVSTLFGGLGLIFSYMVYARYKMHIVIYTLGCVSLTTKNDLMLMIVTLTIGIVLAILLSKPLNALIYGDEYAQQLGYNPRSVIRFGAILASFLTGTAVAFTGVIGFIGLIVPHIARFIVGHDHRFVIPASIFIGGLILCYADVLVRLIALTGLGEIPIGAITSIIGGPFLAYLIVKSLKA